MKYLICKASSEYDVEQQTFLYIIHECVQVFNTEKEACEARDLFQNLRSTWDYDYIVINQNQIGIILPYDDYKS